MDLLWAEQPVAQMGHPQTGKEAPSARGPTDRSTLSAISDDCALAVSNDSDGQMLVWRIQNGEAACRLKNDDGRVACMGFSPNSRRIVAGSESWQIQLWDAQTGEKLRHFRGHEQDIQCVYSLRTEGG